MYRIKDITNKIICGNTLTELKRFPDDCVDTIITSPPYWGLRNYGESTKTIWDDCPNCNHEWMDHKVSLLHENRQGLGRSGRLTAAATGKYKKIHGFQKGIAGFCKKCGAWYGQLGLEPTLDMYINHLSQITAELKRILKPTGVMFWNHGDAYASTGTQRFDDNKYGGKSGIHCGRARTDNYTAKCMLLQNYRLALRMIDEQNWILRNIIVWDKPNHMPSSVKNRFANAYESVFMMVKNTKVLYYYNDKTGSMQTEKPLGTRGVKDIDWGWKKVAIVNDNIFNIRVQRCKSAGSRKISSQYKATKKEIRNYGKSRRKKVSFWHSLGYWFDLDAVRVPHSISTIKRIKYPMNPYGDGGKGIGCKMTGSKKANVGHILIELDSAGKNPGDVWKIPTQAFSGSHFATFPEKLVEPMIKSACPEWICKKCGKARVRLKKTKYIPSGGKTQNSKFFTKEAKFPKINIGPTGMKYGRAPAVHYTIGWTDCGCNAG